MTKSAPHPNETDEAFRARMATERRDRRRRAQMRAFGVPGYDKKKPAGRPRQPESAILPTSVARRAARERAQLRAQGMPGNERAPAGRVSRGTARTPEPGAPDDIEGLIKQLIPDEPARTVIKDWQDQGIRVKFFRGGNRWWIQAHDRVAPVDDFLATVTQEIERAKDNG